MGEFQIIEGDALEELRSLPASSVDSMVTDPPAGISFMGREWDQDHGGRAAWCEAFGAIFAEALRVLKPGSHALVWALPRTSHWTATALEDAGFEIRDVIMHVFGTGFPKSLDVSKAIDSAAGAEREIVAERSEHDITRPRGGGDERLMRSRGAREERMITITKAATAEAREWAGWGTALKPAAEHWILCRKPLAGTVAENVLEHGTGAINVDGCRVGHAKDVPASPRRAKQGPAYGDLSNDPGTGGGWDPTIGRWPANVVLSHSDGCELLGTRELDSDGHYPASRGSGGLSTAGHAGQTELEERHTAGETIEEWSCIDECPVRQLDEQSGELSSGGTPPSWPRDKTRNAYSAFDGQENPNGIGRSSGNASRFFYRSKPATAERNIGNVSNDHPTVKAAGLMSYLCRLITPPDGIVLDPFAGSGSTGIGALREGFRFIGIEREHEYAKLARRRIEGDAPLFNRKGEVLPR
jgi:DNA modification methylase